MGRFKKRIQKQCASNVVLICYRAEYDVNAMRKNATPTKTNCTETINSSDIHLELVLIK